MNERPSNEVLTRARFYELRDERTIESIELEALERTVVAVSIDEGYASSYSGQATLLILVNLLARWCREVQVDIPEVLVNTELAPLGTGSLKATTVNTIKSADPFNGPLSTEASCIVRIHIGDCPPEGAFQVHGAGWLATWGDRVSAHSEVINPLGACLGACVGCCHAMKVAIGDSDTYDSGSLSLWNLSAGESARDGPSLTRGDVSSIALVGAGAVGSSISYLLPLLKIGIDTITVFDKDNVDFSNLNRSPIFVLAHVLRQKVDVIREYLEKTEISVTPIGSWLDEVEDLNLGKFDLVIPAANERNVQIAMMVHCPVVMIGSTTGTNWDINVNRHIALRDDCLECRVPTPIIEPQMKCSTASFGADPTTSADPATGALPFLSLAAAVFATAEIVKLSSFPERLRHNNSLAVGFRAPSTPVLATNRTPKPGCIHCPIPSVYEAVRNSHKFFWLSSAENSTVRKNPGDDIELA